MLLITRNKKIYKDAPKLGYNLCSKCGTIMSTTMLNEFEFTYSIFDYEELDIPDRIYTINICRCCSDQLNHYLLEEYFNEIWD